jgi:hypothetical protein
VLALEHMDDAKLGLISAEATAMRSASADRHPHLRRQAGREEAPCST